MSKILLQIEMEFLPEYGVRYFVDIKEGTAWVNLSSFDDVEEAKTYMGNVYRKHLEDNKVKTTNTSQGGI